jgi:hypothetical protein
MGLSLFSLINWIFSFSLAVQASTNDFHTYCVLEEGDGTDPRIAVTLAPGRGVLFDINNKEFFVEEWKISIESIGEGILYRIERELVLVSEHGSIGAKSELEADIRMLMDFNKISMQFHYVVGSGSAWGVELFCFEQYPQF